MRSDEAVPPFETSDIGTPRDYTEDLYCFYLEIPDPDRRAERLIREWLGTRHAEALQPITHGFELVMPLQCAPDLVRSLVGANVAVYQVVRFAKVAGVWRDGAGSPD
jgi:hypothetical protein